MRFLLIPLGALSVAGCASRESSIPLNGYQAVTAAASTAPVAMTMADYKIGPLDELRIDVLGETELSLEVLPVGANGRIAMPLAGEIVAEGRTANELSRQIATTLKRYLRNPQVAVNVTKYTSLKVTVEGAVREAGVFQAYNQMTLMDAIALGHGLSDYSKESEILVFRRQAGQRYVARFDLGMIRNGEAADPAILPGDVVVVGESNGRRLFTNIVSLLPAALGIFYTIANN